MEFYTVEEVAGILKTTEHTIRKYIRNGQLTAYKVGKAWRIEREDLQVFLRTCKASPAVKEKQSKAKRSLEPDAPCQQQLPLEKADAKEKPESQSQPASSSRLNHKPLDPEAEEGIISIRNIPIEPLPCPKCGHIINYQGPCPECGEPYKKIMASKKKKR